MTISALKRIERARSLLIAHYPFYGVLVSYLEPVEDAACGTMATDGERLFYAPQYVLGLPEDELLGVLAHEAKHCAYGHIPRIGDRDLDIANEAADYAINRDLIAETFKLPNGVLLSAEFGPDMSFEEIYAALISKRQQNQQSQPPQQDGAQSPADGPQGAGGQSPDTGKPDDGKSASEPGKADSGDTGKGKPDDSGKGEPGKPQQDGAGKPQQGKPDTGNAKRNGIGGIMRPQPSAGQSATDKAMEIADKWQTRARQAASVAAKAAGSMPGELARMLADISAPYVDYREVFARIIDSRLVSDYSFMKPDRRFVWQGIYLPGAVNDAIEHLVFVIDTSGSVTDKMGENAISEVQGALDGGKVERVTVLHVDVSVRHVATFERGETIPTRLYGGGGTRFAPAFDWIEENAPDASAVVYLTDMECRAEHFGRDPGLPVAWAIHGDSGQYEKRAARAPFGDPVYVGRLI